MNNTLIFNGLKSSSILVVGNIIAQIIAFLSFSIVASGLGPILYGTYVLVLNYLGFFANFTLGGLNKIILRKSKESEIKQVFNEYLNTRLFLIFISMAACFISLFLVPYEYEVKLYIFYFSVIIAVDCLVGYFSNYFIILQKTKFLSTVTVFSQLMRSSLNIFLVLNNFGVFHLLFSMIFTQSVMLFILYIRTYNALDLSMFTSPKINFGKIGTAIVFTLIGFFSFLSLQINITIVSIIGDKVEVGIYATALILATLIQNIRNTISTVFIPITSTFLDGKMDEYKFKRLFILSTYIFFLITPFCFTLSYFSEYLFDVILSSEYEESSEIFRVLIFYVIFAWVTLPFTLASQVLDLQFTILKIFSIMSVLNIFLSLFFYSNYGLVGMAYSTLITYFFGSFMKITFLSRKLKLKYIDYNQNTGFGN